MGEKAIVLDHVGMRFNLSKEKTDSIKDYFIKLVKRDLHYNEFWALKDVSFAVEKGDRVGVLGLNGAGKSTLLKVIAGVFKPTEGTVVRKGKIAPLLELGADLTKNIPVERIFICMGQCLVTARSLLKRNLMRLWNSRNWENL